jgi:hypothetical protein
MSRFEGSPAQRLGRVERHGTTKRAVDALLVAAATPDICVWPVTAARNRLSTPPRANLAPINWQVGSTSDSDHLFHITDERATADRGHRQTLVRVKWQSAETSDQPRARLA